MFDILIGPELSVVDAEDRPDRLELRIGEDVACVVDRRDRRLGCLERLQHLGPIALADPCRDGVVDLVDVGGAARAGREPGLLHEVRPADEAKNPRRDRVGARRDRDPGFVRRPVDVSRRVVARAVARARL